MTCRMTSHSYWWRGTIQLSWTAVQYSCILPWKAWVRAHEDGGRTASDGSWTLKLSLREKYRWCASGLRKGPKPHFFAKCSFISHGFHVLLYHVCIMWNKAVGNRPVLTSSENVNLDLFSGRTRTNGTFYGTKVLGCNSRQKPSYRHPRARVPMLSMVVEYSCTVQLFRTAVFCHVINRSVTSYDTSS